MAGILQNNSLQLGSAILSNPNGQAPMYGARALSNSSGASIRRSSNISSIQGLGGGLYRFNFQQSMPNNNYACITAGGRTGQNAATSWSNRQRTYDTGEVTIEVSDPVRDRGINPNDLAFAAFGN
ncbi:hypothetical protein S820908_199 [Synechococcus phage S-CAM9]|uniref:Uncharacterized protein n=1 Tax=Synechococcus phage S-CAM9 TaxID=1883369 RepID=A0A1D8KNU8_9CAUD|nr:hypothetical protein BOW85_gp049 [Synechococcus phage S-CAM9]AOV60346.1 hypothetical protein S050808_199 [Synechococcus phage S-CAM9]AOV60574.1 hypothetical protein S820908_199 [Synechococcus phage S-CAM9]AOV60803.1 hypothetical protein N161109_200 [Synechococcus phage S-CAM9]